MKLSTVNDKLGTFLREARACWEGSTTEQKQKMVPLLRYINKNKLAGKRIRKSCFWECS